MSKRIRTSSRATSTRLATASPAQLSVDFRTAPASQLSWLASSALPTVRHLAVRELARRHARSLPLRQALESTDRVQFEWMWTFTISRVEQEASLCASYCDINLLPTADDDDDSMKTLMGAIFAAEQAANWSGHVFSCVSCGDGPTDASSALFRLLLDQCAYRISGGDDDSNTLAPFMNTITQAPAAVRDRWTLWIVDEYIPALWGMSAPCVLAPVLRYLIDYAPDLSSLLVPLFVKLNTTETDIGSWGVAVSQLLPAEIVALLDDRHRQPLANLISYVNDEWQEEPELQDAQTRADLAPLLQFAAVA